MRHHGDNVRERPVSPTLPLHIPFSPRASFSPLCASAFHTFLLLNAMVFRAGSDLRLSEHGRSVRNRRYGDRGDHGENLRKPPASAALPLHIPLSPRGSFPLSAPLRLRVSYLPTPQRSDNVARASRPWNVMGRMPMPRGQDPTVTPPRLGGG